ncbi:MAG: hypothetical protein Q8L01_01395, partial [Candidatus Woesebacteria bacterium]|nr:hypothetical protein [Candidatus Woesebacteria bacterium]
FIKKAFIIIEVFVLFSVVFYLTLFFGNKILIEKDSNFITNGVGAFAGAFFAFLFLIVERLLEKIYLRNKKHRNALVKIEYTLQEYLSINYDNIFLLEGSIGSMEKGYVNVGHFIKLEINREILLDLYNIDLINDFHTLNTETYKDNESLETVSSWYNKINESFLDAKMNIESRDINIKQILENYKKLKLFLESLEKSIITVQAKVRVLLQEQESAIDWLIKIISHKEHYPNNFDKKVKEEIEKVKEEIEQSTKASKKEIDNILQS